MGNERGEGSPLLFSADLRPWFYDQDLTSLIGGACNALHSTDIIETS